MKSMKKISRITVQTLKEITWKALWQKGILLKRCAYSLVVCISSEMISIILIRLAHLTRHGKQWLRLWLWCQVNWTTARYLMQVRNLLLHRGLYSLYLYCSWQSFLWISWYEYPYKYIDSDFIKCFTISVAINDLWFSNHASKCSHGKYTLIILRLNSLKWCNK